MIKSELDRTSFLQTLRRGGYSLLVGAGVTADSQNYLGESLGTARNLQKRICDALGIPDNIELQRVTRNLSVAQVRELLTVPYSNTKPADWLKQLPKYIWNQIYTFNIDDTLESVWNSEEFTQNLDVINFDEPYRQSSKHNQLRIVHLHGYVGKPNSGYVFSHTDYGRILRKPNPWLNILGDQIASESFIIAGTSLTEVDLEFYLKDRSESTPRNDTGPSLLIEPYPIPGLTEIECKRLGLLHIEATFEEFLKWVATQLPNPPNLLELLVPDQDLLFNSASPDVKIRFFADWQLRRTTPVKKVRVANSGFFFGQPPKWSDLEYDVDVGRSFTSELTASVLDTLQTSGDTRLFRISGAPGTGKTTTLLRAGYSLAEQGIPVFTVRGVGRLDQGIAIKSLREISEQCVLLVDNLAEHARQVAHILDDSSIFDKLVVIAADRKYRDEHLDTALRGISQNILVQPELVEREALQLIEKYRRLGLLASARNVSGFELKTLVQSDSVSVAVCHILNDFKPLSRIVETVWEDSEESIRNIYITAALAQYCYNRGVQRYIIQQVVGTGVSVDSIVEKGSLPLYQDQGYLRPLSPVIGEQLLRHLSHSESTRQYVLDAFITLADAIAPYISIDSLRNKSPEAQIARRLFDASVTQEFLKDSASEFYELASVEHGWNSRFWQQRAMYESDYDLNLAIKYAEHSLQIEWHPFGLTVLGQLQMRGVAFGGSAMSFFYEDAFNNLTKAISREREWKRPAANPYTSLFLGTCEFVRQGGNLGSGQIDLLHDLADFAEQEFAGDKRVIESISSLDNII